MRLLLAEDDLTTRRVLQAIVPRWGYEVTTAADGQEAWRVLEHPDAPKLVLLDWEMPGMDGLEVCRRIRARPTPVPPYIVLLTARGQPAEIVAGFRAGANDYVAKPYDNEELQMRLGVGRRMLELQEALTARVAELQAALAHVKQLQGLLPICMYCHKIRTDASHWDRLETYISAHSDAEFSHGICPVCLERHCADLADVNHAGPQPELSAAVP